MDVGFDCETRGRQQALKRYHIVAIEPEAIGEQEPAGDPAVAFPLAVVIE